MNERNDLTASSKAETPPSSPSLSGFLEAPKAAITDGVPPPGKAKPRMVTTMG